MAQGWLSRWFGGGDEEEDDIETQAIQYYKDNKGKSLMMNPEGNAWALDYIPSSLSRADQQQWMMLSDGKLGIRR